MSNPYMIDAEQPRIADCEMEVGAGILMTIPEMRDLFRFYRGYMKYTGHGKDVLDRIDLMVADIEKMTTHRGISIECATDPSISFDVEFIEADNRGPIMFFPATIKDFEVTRFDSIPKAHIASRKVNIYDDCVAVIRLVNGLTVANALEIASAPTTRTWMSDLAAETKAILGEYRTTKDDEYWRSITGLWMYTKS